MRDKEEGEKGEVKKSQPFCHSITTCHLVRYQVNNFLSHVCTTLVCLSLNTKTTSVSSGIQIQSIVSPFARCCQDCPLKLLVIPCFFRS